MFRSLGPMQRSSPDPISPRHSPRLHRPGRRPEPRPSAARARATRTCRRRASLERQHRSNSQAAR
eukprot:1636199-Alexandrium_andersonii.AAC.1